MNIDVSESFFESVKSDFLKLDCSVLDEKMQELIARWKTSPVLDIICPRWSCQSHSTNSRDADYEIIFVTTNGGSEYLYKIFQALVDDIVSREGMNRLASTQYSVINLCKPKFIKPETHIKIGIMANGDTRTIDKCITSWFSVLDKVDNGHI
jgi:hypothetical protein